MQLLARPAAGNPGGQPVKVGNRHAINREYHIPRPHPGLIGGRSRLYGPDLTGAAEGDRANAQFAPLPHVDPRCGEPRSQLGHRRIFQARTEELQLLEPLEPADDGQRLAVDRHAMEAHRHEPSQPDKLP